MKLAALASDFSEDTLQEKIEEMAEQERFLLHQETLPEQLLAEKTAESQCHACTDDHNRWPVYLWRKQLLLEYDLRRLDLLNILMRSEDVNINDLNWKSSKALQR